MVLHEAVIGEGQTNFLSDFILPQARYIKGKT